MAKFKAAFYKGTHPGVAGIYNRLVRWWTRSPYSHVELIFFDGGSGADSQAASSSSPSWRPIAPITAFRRRR